MFFKRREQVKVVHAIESLRGNHRQLDCQPVRMLLHLRLLVLCSHAPFRHIAVLLPCSLAFLSLRQDYLLAVGGKTEGIWEGVVTGYGLVA